MSWREAARRAKNAKEPEYFPFGIHKDVPFEFVPTKYLEWFVSSADNTDSNLYRVVESIYQGRMAGIIPRPSTDYERD